MNRRMSILGLFLVPVMWTNLLVAGDRPFSVELRGSYTTTSEILFNRDVGNGIELDNIFGFGLDVRRNVAYNLEVGVSVEYISTSDLLRDRTGLVFPLQLDDGYRFIPQLDDGYQFIPLELSAYFLIPFSGDRVKVYMGGGLGLYIGQWKFKEAGVMTETLEKETGFGIHVVSGLDYFLTPNFSLRGELKFRDPQVESTSKLPDHPPFQSRINIDGITFNLGAVFHF